MRTLLLSGIILIGTGCSSKNNLDAYDTSAAGVSPQSFDSLESGVPVPEDIRHSLLSEREGWGAQATGGTTTFVVTSLADSGDGTLRQALSQAGRWITFRLNGTIALESPLWIPPNTTIDARLRGINIETTSSGTFSAAFFIHGANNVIITNLNLDNARIYGSTWKKDSEGHDAIEVRNSTDLWFHRNTFAHWGDGAIDVRYSDNSVSGIQLPWGGTGLPRVLPSRISITRNKFRNIFQALSLTGDRISFGHNHCVNVQRRCIKAIYGRSYSYNNLIESWGDKSIQDVKDLPSGINPPGKDQYGNHVGNPAERFGAPRAELLSEQNVFNTKDVSGKALKVNKSSNGKVSCKNNHGEVEFIDINDDLSKNVFEELRNGRFAVRKVECKSDDKSCISNKIRKQAEAAGASMKLSSTSKSLGSKSSETDSKSQSSHLAEDSDSVSSDPNPLTQIFSPLVASQCPNFSRTPVSGDSKSCGKACRKQLRSAAEAIGFKDMPNSGLDKYSVAKDVYKAIRSRGKRIGCDPLRDTQF